MSPRRPIQLLDDALIDQIAAGEVIERPASAVKELVENALDARARHIEVALEQGGLDLLEVSDDGEGISRDDLPLAIVAHATSKISTLEDLHAVSSRGFRGEALASMGAVGDLEIVTRAAGSPEAWLLEVGGGKPGVPKPTARAQGTTVRLRHLFRHVPARRKFLKSPRAECLRCEEWLDRLALSVPGVELTLRLDGRVKRQWRAGGMEARIEDVTRASGFRKGEASGSGFEVMAWVAEPACAKVNRNGQFFYYNSRPIRDRMLSQVLLQSTREFIPDRRHAVAVIHISSDPTHADVNVHPTKEEVRFDRPRDVASLVTRAVRSALAGGGYAPELISMPRPQVQEPSPSPNLPRAQRPVAENWNAPGLLGEAHASPAPSRRFMQVHGSFVVVETDEGLSILDQHALHERILLETMRRELLAGGVERQNLLIPQSLQFQPGEAAALQDLGPHLEKAGFAIEVHGSSDVLVSALPVSLSPGSLQGLLRDIVERADGISNPDDIRLLATRLCACRSAVKAGDTLEPGEIEALIRGLSEEDYSFACEHGRPTHVRIPLARLSRGFARH
ncbi:MAG: DNA mismatch repair endonuclease MutL [Planctomycetota bacterium]